MLASASALAPPNAKTNLDESKVVAYTLPPILKTLDGHTVRTAKQWQQRRVYLLQQFADNIYGRMPAAPVGIHAHVDRVDHECFG